MILKVDRLTEENQEMRATIETAQAEARRAWSENSTLQLKLKDAQSSFHQACLDADELRYSNKILRAKHERLAEDAKLGEAIKLIGAALFGNRDQSDEAVEETPCP